MLTTVSTLSISLFLLWNNGKTDKTPQVTKPRKSVTVIAENTPIPTQQNPEPQIKQAVIQKQEPLVSTLQELVTELPITAIVSENKGTARSNDDSFNRRTISPKPMDDIPYQFPKLTEEEIAITKKKKKAMLKALAKHDKNAYVFIPSGSFDYNGKQVSCQAFYMGVGEVTNFEYRTFLFDLLIQGRKDEFLKAKPDQTQWSKLEKLKLTAFEEHYFSHKAYDDYPVVNISREGAELYCKWISQEVRKYVGDEKEGKYNDVRLPVRAEWAKAASNEGKMLPYPWGGPYARNSKGLVLANYSRSRQEYLDETGNIAYKENAAGSDITAPSKSFWPSELGLYNLSGNVAEMVYEGMDKSEPGTAGGSWRNNKDEIKIYASDPYKGVTEGSPMIGFRVVSTYLIVYDKK